jgi:anti-sigma B factor antagonist
MADEWADEPVPSELIVRRAETDRAVIFHLTGEVDVATALSLLLELSGVEHEMPAGKVLVIDMTEVTFLASAGLALVVDVARRCGTTGVELRVVTGNRTVKSAFSTSGLTETLTLVDHLADAA